MHQNRLQLVQIANELIKNGINTETIAITVSQNGEVYAFPVDGAHIEENWRTAISRHAAAPVGFAEVWKFRRANLIDQYDTDARAEGIYTLQRLSLDAHYTLVNRIMACALKNEKKGVAVHDVIGLDIITPYPVDSLLPVNADKSLQLLLKTLSGNACEQELAMLHGFITLNAKAYATP